MKNNKFKKMLSLILCSVSIAAMILCSNGCGKQQTATQSAIEQSPDVTVIGEGNTVFLFDVTDPDGNVSSFEVHTDSDTVGDALINLGMINGEPGDYGLYVKTVNGITVDYDTDQKYWAFYIDGEYAMSGVDTTPIENGKQYSFKAE